MLNPIGTRLLYTPRLLLRPFIKDDAPALFHNFASKKEVTKYLNWSTHTSLAQSEYVVNFFVQSYKDPFYFNWAIIDRSNNVLVGSISLHHIDQENNSGELGICLSPSYWHRHIGSEAANKIIEYAFNSIGLHRLEAKVDADNLPSNGLMKKLGMNYEGQLKEAFFKKDYKNLNLYALINPSSIR